jgi:transcription elongation factor
MYHPIIISLAQNEIQATNKGQLKHMVVLVLLQSSIEMKDRMHVQIFRRYSAITKRVRIRSTSFEEHLIILSKRLAFEGNICVYYE